MFAYGVPTSVIDLELGPPMANDDHAKAGEYYQVLPSTTLPEPPMY